MKGRWKRVVCWVPALIAAGLLSGSCDKLDDTRIPLAPVHIVFNSMSDWVTWGVNGATDTRRFIIEEKVPKGYPYTALDATGYGGLLLVNNVQGEIKVFDLSCPVECKRTVRVSVNMETLTAECPVCHSQYDVFSLDGYPISGPAAEDGWGLRHYHATQGLSPYMAITN